MIFYLIKSRPFIILKHTIIYIIYIILYLIILSEMLYLSLSEFKKYDNGKERLIVGWITLYTYCCLIGFITSNLILHFIYNLYKF